MAKFTISNSEEEVEIKPQVPKYERKGRFSIEEEQQSQFKRKSEIALKNLGKGAVSSLSGLYELAKTPLSLTAKDPREMLQRSAELSKELEEKFGLTPPEAETATERLMEGAFKGAGAGLPFGAAGAITGLTGGLAGAGAKEFGASESIATGLDILTSLATPTGFLRKAGEKIVSKSPELAKRAAVTTSEKLPKVRGTLKEPIKLIKPAITPENLENFNRKIGLAIEKKSSEIMEESLLGKQLESKGTIIGDLIDTAYDQTRSLAQKNKTPIDLTNLSKSIRKSAEEIEKKAPSLAGSTEAVVNKLKKYANDFAPTEIKKTEGAVNILDQFGKPISRTAKYKPTTMTAEQLTDQWVEVNKDLNSMYTKTELSGAEELYRKSLENVKKELLNEATSQLKDPTLINSFKQQNKLYHEAQKFDKAKAILDPVFENGFSPHKFKQIFSSDRKFSDLKKALGKKNAYRLKDIQKYYVQPIENLKKEFKIKTLFNLEDMVKGAIVKKMIGLPVTVALKVTPHIYGKLITSENTQNLWIHLMRSIKDGSVRGVEKYSEALEKDLQE